MRILFIGGTGLISSACSAAAVAAGHELWVLNRGRSALGGFAALGRVLTADAADEAAVRAAVKGLSWDVVVQWIGYAPSQVEQDIGVFGEVGQYVFISSASVYAKPPAHWIITENTPKANPGDGTSIWTLTHNTDFAQGLMGLLGQPAALGDDFHITSDEALTWNQIYSLVGAAADAEPDIVHVPTAGIIAADPAEEGSLRGDKMYSTVFDNAKLRRLVPGYTPVKGFAQGIRETVAWFDADAGRRQIDEAANARWDRLAAVYSDALAKAAD